jgi:hypothetical protein
MDAREKVNVSKKIRQRTDATSTKGYVCRLGNSKGPSLESRERQREAIKVRIASSEDAELATANRSTVYVDL